jgi:Cft2 family RNA processing exonuclease
MNKNLFQIEDKSVFIPAAQIHLDSKDRKSLGFVSHAHIDHIAKHNKIICTDKTAQFIQFRLKKPNCLEMPYSKSIELNNAKVTLIPAGHILGSAQILIETDKSSLLYTGDFRTGPSRTAEQHEVRQVDIVIMESTFGMPQYCFPPRREVEELLIKILREKLEQEITPIVFAYALGKSQEVLHLLGNSGLPVAVDYSILKYARIYEKFNIDFGSYQIFKRSQFKGKVLLLPTGFRRNRYVESIENKYTIYLSGWGMDSSARYRLGVDEVIPYSDHADFNELIEFATKVDAREIYCTHGFDQFASILRDKGYNARPLFKPVQLELF